MTVREALNAAIEEEMIRDEKVFLLGEEVAQYNVRFRNNEGGTRYSSPYTLHAALPVPSLLTLLPSLSRRLPLSLASCTPRLPTALRVLSLSALPPSRLIRLITIYLHWIHCHIYIRARTR